MRTANDQPKTALLVDVGGVLLVLNSPALAPIIARHGGVTTTEDFYRAHCAAHNAANPSLGEPRGNYYDLLPEFAGVPEANRSVCTRDYLAASRTKNMWHFPDAESKASLDHFKSHGIKIAIVSQADGHIAEMLLEAKMCQEGVGPGVQVDRVYDSAIVGLDKPDPRFFLHAVEGLGADADSAVHVGDTVPADVRGAEAAGILAVHFDPYDDCDAPSDHEHVRTLAEMEQHLLTQDSALPSHNSPESGIQ